MSKMNYVYRNPRPKLTIHCDGGAGLGNCYSASYWRVTSTTKLTKEQLKDLYNIGVLGFGQEFYIKQWEEKPSGVDEVPCRGEDDQGVVVDLHPTNPYSGKPYESTKMPYWVYLIESRVDSSD